MDISERKEDETLKAVIPAAWLDLRSKVDIQSIRQRQRRGWGDAILHAEKQVRNEPGIVMLGDTITVALVPVARQLLDVHRSFGASAIAIEKVRRESISSYGSVAVCPTSALGRQDNVSPRIQYLIKSLRGKQASPRSRTGLREPESLYLRCSTSIRRRSVGSLRFRRWRESGD